MHKEDVKRGFTLIEVSLSVAFIAVLSLSVAVVMINAITAYHRGVVMNQVNTVGMELVDDIRRSIQGASVRTIRNECHQNFPNQDELISECEKDKGKSFVTALGKSVTIDKVGEVPLYGAFCTGSYSYIWNSGYLFSSDFNVGEEKAVLKYKNGTTIEDDFKLLKVWDRNRSVCIGDKSEYRNSNSVVNNGFSVDYNYDGNNEPDDLLAGGEHNLALYNLDAWETKEGSGLNSAFFSVSFILATVQGGININVDGGYCTTVDSGNFEIEAFDYCAINKFNFAAQANGGY